MQLLQIGGIVKSQPIENGYQQDYPSTTSQLAFTKKSGEPKMPSSQNSKMFLPMVTLALLLTAALTLSACTQEVPPANPPEPVPAEQPAASIAEPAAETPTNTLPQATEKVFVPAGADAWRDYSFEPASIETWTNEEGDQILDVWVRIDYKNNPGTAVRDEQQWHIDFANNRYKVSDSFAFDADGNYCET
ncbi:hypothetical protein [Acidaminobacter hydrogenoformans]|uniref:hypothetical protein n=1 Tax=Acidaminobacter hydrogenoformans TaxID=65403 RepID=UPI001113CB19|nr:hypothetical protein [Acidaminobacter hydrogenoformans]